ncbi:MAG TPA: NAD(P)/FAD-dependent oxidoreductase [Halobacteriales archaeon]|nr:NAD(P)/FAD-dependent oxidoreductase [Halobacteriales archaeon]
MIGIIGGGLAGLSAAYYLQQKGYQVRIFEGEKELGGLAASYDTEGDSIEKFYHHLSKSEETIVELAEELGMGDKVEWKIGKNAYYIDGEIFPLDTPWDILRYPHLTIYDKIRLTLLTLGIDARGIFPKIGAYQNLEEFEHTPVEDFVREHTTNNIFDKFVTPLLEAKFGEHKHRVSAAWLLGRIKFRGQRDFLKGEVLGYINGGFVELIDTLIREIGQENIITGAFVEEIIVENGRVESMVIDTKNGKLRENVDAVIVATMPSVLENLTGYECPIQFQGAVCALMSYSEKITETYWLNISDKSRFGAIIEHTNFIDPRRYGGEHLTYMVSYIQDFEESIWKMTDKEIEEYWVKGIEEMIQGFDRQKINWFKVSRNPLTAPIYEMGYVDKIVPYDISEEVGEGIYYAGMASRAQYPERSLNGAIEAGYACASLIVKRGEDSI